MANYLFKNHWPCFHTFVSRLCWTLFCCITLSISIIHNVTESRVRLLAAQKPIKRVGWWEGKLALFWMPANSSLVWGVGGAGAEAGDGKGRGWSREADACAKMDSFQWQRARVLIGRGREPHAETAQSALTMILRSVIGGLIRVTLIFLRTVNFWFQGQSFLRGQFSEAWQLVLWLQSGHHVVNILPGRGFKIYKQVIGYSSEYYL